MRSYRVLAGTGAVALSLLVSDLAGGTAQASALSTTIHSCAPAKAGFVSCFAIVRTDRSMTAAQADRPNVTPSGYGPARSSRPTSCRASASGRTVAIVDAYNDPTAEADLGVYRAQFGLPACTTANGCFQQGQPDRQHHRPAGRNAGWAQEICLDLDMVSATCPTATSCWSRPRARRRQPRHRREPGRATAGVVAISNSYGGADARDTRTASTTTTPASP